MSAYIYKRGSKVNKTIMLYIIISSMPFIIETFIIFYLTTSPLPLTMTPS